MTDNEKKLIIRLEQLDEFRKALLAVVYTKPENGIPKTDLVQAVQDSLGKADTALQPADLTELTGKVQALEALIEADSDGAINKFNEIVTFLSNITDSQTLAGIVSGINDAISGKVDKVEGKGLSTNDYDNDAKAKVDELAYATTEQVKALFTAAE